MADKPKPNELLSNINYKPPSLRRATFVMVQSPKTLNI
jgi:hypothetical protein